MTSSCALAVAIETHIICILGFISLVTLNQEYVGGGSPVARQVKLADPKMLTSWLSGSIMIMGTVPLGAIGQQQSCPTKSSVQLQVYPPTSSTHTPPFRQGVLPLPRKQSSLAAEACARKRKYMFYEQLAAAVCHMMTI